MTFPTDDGVMLAPLLSVRLTAMVLRFTPPLRTLVGSGVTLFRAMISIPSSDVTSLANCTWSPGQREERKKKLAA